MYFLEPILKCYASTEKDVLFTIFLICRTCSTVSGTHLSLSAKLPKTEKQLIACPLPVHVPGINPYFAKKNVTVFHFLCVAEKFDLLSLQSNADWSAHGSLTSHFSSKNILKQKLEESLEISSEPSSFIYSKWLLLN